jgi:hypothetical protein
MVEEIAKPGLISDPALADARWFTEVLRYAGALRDGIVTEFQSQRIGTGQMGQNFAFALTYEGPHREAPATVVGKFPSHEAKSRQAAKMFRTYEREVGFYQEIAGTVDIRVPHCYLADIDLETGDFVLLFEDLRPAVQGNQLAGCGIEQAMLAMDELAALHAPRWGDPSLARIAWLGQAEDSEPNEMIQRVYQGLWPGFVAQFGASLSAEELALGEAFGTYMKEWRSAFTPPYCVTHGDYRIDNMLFGTEEGGYPLTTVDWQTIGHGAGIMDAAYFIGNGPRIPERRAHEMELLRRYHSGLCARGVSGYAWDECFTDYRRATFAGILMTVVASQVVASDERGVAMFAAMAERHFAHAIDQKAGDFLRAG